MLPCPPTYPWALTGAALLPPVLMGGGPAGHGAGGPLPFATDDE